MVKMLNLDLFVGNKDEYLTALNNKMKVVCCISKGQLSHLSVAGMVNSTHQDYLYKETKDGLFLNMVDADNIKYIPGKMISKALDYIDNELAKGNKVFVFCSLGQSRSPSIALMYLFRANLISSISEFIRIYPKYKPNTGILDYVKKYYSAT